MRKKVLSVFLPLLMVNLGSAAEAPVTDSHNAALQKLTVLRSNGEISVAFTAHGLSNWHVSEIDSPSRVVVDMPNTTAAVAQRNIAVDSAMIKGVRVGESGGATRLVVDLQHPVQYELKSQGNDRYVLELHEQAASAAVAPAPEVKAAEKTVEPATAPVAAAASTDPANNFVVVEPSYKPKTDESSPAAEAASQNVERPEQIMPPASASMQTQTPAAPATSAAPSAPAVNLAAEQKAQMDKKPVASGPKYTGEPISVNLKDVDVKDFFRLIHEISGLNVVLDPNVKGTLTIVLDDVPWDQALDIVLKNNDLARQLEGNLLRIATVDTLKHEADARREQQTAEALAVDKVTVTRFLSYAHSKDVVATVKKFISQRGDVISDDRTNAIIISDIPSVMPGLDRLLTQLDRKTQEVEIEARVVAATRTFARDIGTQLGFGFGNHATSVGGASSVGTSPVGTFGLTPLYPVVGTSAPSPTTLSQIPLFSNLAATSPTSGFTLLNASSAVQIDAILTMAESRGLLKILSRPRVVTQNNIQAVVKQGTKLPIVTLAQLNGPPTVTYVDALLRLTVIPQITAEGTIFLNVDVENTTPDFSRTVNGNPTLLTQQATTQVLVTDGGTVVIGGVVQTQNSINISQVPLLGNIPYLGNLFKHSTVSTSNQELIFFITPRVIQT